MIMMRKITEKSTITREEMRKDEQAERRATGKIVRPSENTLCKYELL